MAGNLLRTRRVSNGPGATASSSPSSKAPIALALLLLVTLSACPTSNAIWWDEDADDSLDNLYTKHCADDLAANRTSLLQLCRLSQYEINSLVRGARTGIAICQLQYKSERWNCSSNDWNAFLSKIHREAAYVHAVISVAVSSKLMEDCNSGRLPSVAICNASAKCRESGCTKEIIDYSTNTAKVLDWLHNPAQLSNMKYRQAIVHHHNRDVGRIIVKKHMKDNCRCFGPSASCVSIKCARILPQAAVMIRNLTENLRFLPWKNNRHSVFSTLKKLRKQPYGKTTLIYMKRSPSYCCRDKSQGILGTDNRVCLGPDSCKKICCSGQYEATISHNCNCKFEYCCRLRCQRCTEQVFRCKPAACQSS